MLSSAPRRVAATAAASVLAATLLAACDSTSDGSASGRVRIGISGSGSDWDVLKEKAKAEGIDVELVTFDDYALPNKALAAGDIELNAFQHLAFLSQFNANTGTDIVPIGATSVAPLGLFSLKHKSVDRIPDNGQIAIPNDPSNQGRALRVLEQAKLLKLKDTTGLYGTPDDITDNPRHLKIVPVDAQQTPRSLQDVDGAVINSGVAGQAGYEPKQAIFQDDPEAPTTRPYVNVIAARAKDRDNPTYKRIAELYHSPEVQAASAKESKGSSVPSDLDAPALQAELDRLTKQVKAG
ncbi:MetQ/NlpA family ABC transporter substrate-binding protein [Kitasatospora sp. NPDC056138]|uniref:MetQ/NlpA family ABC transporter substrate-binding protein n=1 Tax=Kitasatospora sp. NPDC056138 TaxID=3345724 RepID=UPI0035D74004